MTTILATIVIAVSFVIFHYLWSNILITILIDIPATVKLGKKNIINKREALREVKKVLAIITLIVLFVLGINYYLFVMYSFGYSISIFFGALLALAEVAYKTIILLRSYKNSDVWIDFYRKSNNAFLTTYNIDDIKKALNDK